MAHTFSYSYIGALESEQPQVERHMVMCTVTLSTAGDGDNYSRTDYIDVAFSRYLSNVSHAIVYSGIPIANEGLVPVLCSISGSTVKIGLLESGPGAQGPLREYPNASAIDRAYVVYVIGIGI